MRCEAIYAHSSEFSVRKMCRTLELCESSYYQWLRGEKRRQKKRELEQDLIKQVQKVFDDTNRIYGCRRLQKALLEEKIVLSEWKVRRIMRENGMYPESLKKFKPGKNGNKDGKYFDNTVKQDFRCEKPDEKWVGDITYLKTKLGWVYLATVMDLYNREIIGYYVSRQMDSEIVCRALDRALQKRENKEKTLIFHSDRSCQYCSKRYQAMLSENNIQGSMSKAGCPYDNSCMESFYASLKKEYYYRREYATIEEIEMDLFYYIEIFYNRKRLHSSLGYMSPVAYRLKGMGLTAA